MRDLRRDYEKNLYPKDLDQENLNAQEIVTLKNDCNYASDLDKLKPNF